MIRRAKKLIEELKICLDSDDVVDSIKVFKIISQLKDLPLATLYQNLGLLSFLQFQLD